jgi:hypothetical protein
MTSMAIGSKKALLLGALAAVVVVVPIASALAIWGGAVGLLFTPVVPFFGVVLGSILTIFPRTRRFAVGFLMTSAILIFLTAGVCVIGLRTGSGSA